MPTARLTIWCNTPLTDPARDLLRDGTRGHNLVFSPHQKVSTLAGGPPDPALSDADVALGQPDPEMVIRYTRLRWVQVDSAGYTRYDRDDLRAALRARGAMLTNSSAVFDDPCAHHVLAMMLAFARQLPQCLLDQQANRAWRPLEHRARSSLLNGQTVLVLGFGSIARRLVELLRPFGMNLIGTRRTPRGDEPIRVVPESQTNALLPAADHVVDVLPDSESTRRYFNADRFARMKPTALFYNIGRGTTVDQSALVAALYNRQIAGAYLDVTDPEPLPPEDLLWRAPNCFITPHTAGGHHDEFEQIVRHFLGNLRRFEQGEALENRVV
jgi:phosphoglycerate dehydrogenase-like enzyme